MQKISHPPQLMVRFIIFHARREGKQVLDGAQEAAKKVLALLT